MGISTIVNITKKLLQFSYMLRNFVTKTNSKTELKNTLIAKLATEQFGY